MILRKILIGMLASPLCASGAFALSATLTAKMDSSYIEAGRHTAVHLFLEQPKERTLEFQMPQDSVIEFVKMGKCDTADGGMTIKIRQDVIITAFDSGRFVVPAFKYLEPQTGETVESNTMELDVQTMEVEMDEEKLKDVKDIYDVPFDWGFVIKLLIILALLGVAGYFGYKYREKLLSLIRKRVNNAKGEGEGAESEPEIVLPPHETALNALEELKKSQIWKEEGQMKEYYSRLTEIIREYFCARFGIKAMEMTSDEIIDELKYNSEAKPIMGELKNIVSKADMAKFAKVNPTSEDCEMNLVDAFFIVNQTIKTEPQTDANADNITSEK